MTKLSEFGFITDNYQRVIVTWGWDPDVPQAREQGVLLWDFRGTLQDIAKSSSAKDSYWTDDTMRTLQLMAKAASS